MNAPAGKTRRQRWRYVLGIAVAFALLAWIIYRHRDAVTKLPRFDAIYLLPIALLFVAAKLQQGVVFLIATRMLKLKTRLLECTAIMAGISYANLLVPRSGLALPAVYLRKRYDVPASDMASLLLPLAVIRLPMLGALGLASLVWLSTGAASAPPTWAYGLFGCVLVGGLVVCVARLPIPEHWEARPWPGLRRMNEAWSRFGRSPKVAVVFVALSLLGLAMRMLRLVLACWALDVSISFPGALLLVVCGGLAMLISLTPGGLGFREVAISLAGAEAGITPDQALAAALIDRAVMFVGTIVIGQVSLILLAREAGGTQAATSDDDPQDA